MSFRPAPAKRPARHSWEREDRRTLYINLVFVASIVLGLLFLVVAAGVSYYDDHFSTVAVVNGTTLTKDDLRGRVLVDTWRLQRIATNVQNSLSAGRITQAQADDEYKRLQSEQQQLPGSSLDKLIDTTLQVELAEKEGVAVTEAQIDEALTTEATAPEARHVWVIAMRDSGTTGDGAGDAKSRIEKTLADLKAGADWETTAKAVSEDATAEKGGDLGWVTRDAGTDDFLAALFALKEAGITGVVADADGTYRIGRVSEIQASQVDPNYQQAITDAKVPIESYRLAVKGELARKVLEGKIVADTTTKPTLMRRVSEILLKGNPATPAGDQVKTSHILFSPNGDPNAASSVSSGDPAWAAAEASANTVYAALEKDPAKFAELAAQSNDVSSAANGGDLPWFTKDEVDPAFGDAIFADGLTAGEILKPVRSSYGWHVIRFEERRPGPGERIKELRTKALAAGADFAALARESSEAADAAAGGEMGWIAKNQLSAELEKAIFAAPVGKVSDVIEGSDGWYLFLVAEEASRVPEGDQVATLQAKAFDNWYAQQKEAASITQEPLPDKL